MTLRVGIWFATLGILGAQQLPPAAPPDDDVTLYLRERRALTERTMAANALANSARDALGAKDYRLAEAQYRKALQADPQNMQALEGVARVYRAEGRTGEALLFLQEEVAKNPTWQNLAWALVDMAVEVKQYDLALATLRQSVAYLPQRDLYLRIADVYRIQGDLKSSIAALRKAVSTLPESAIKVALARDLMAAGQTEEANRTYRDALGVDPTDGAALLRRAEELRSVRMGNNILLESCAELAIQLRPDDLEALDLLATTYSNSGRRQEAISLFLRLLGKAPEVSAYHYHYAQALVVEGSERQVEAELELALKYNPSDEDRARIEQKLQSIQAIAAGAKKK